MTTTKIRLWTVEEYHRMIDTGILTPDDRVELLEGCIIEMSPQRPLHSGTTQRATDYIKRKLGVKAHVRMQLPITFSTSEPEPDIAIVKIDSEAYGKHHPTSEDIFFLIEVSYRTLKKDREQKALIYARANITEYWILDVIKRQVYIFRHPSINGYESEIIFDETASLAPLAFPEIEIPFSELFLP